MLLTHCTLLAPHRKPATKPTITSPDGDEDDVMDVDRDVSSQSHQHRTTSNNAHQNSSASPEGDENADDEDNPSEGDNDLSGLNSASLRKKISSEVKSFVFLFICSI